MDLKRAVQKPRVILLGLCLLTLVLNLWGVRRDLPYVHDRDEQFFVLPAYGMAVTGRWDPHWFGHPGSTMIYPLRMIFAAWITAAHGGKDFESGSLEESFERHAAQYYLIGRLLSIFYVVASVPIIFLLFQEIFSRRIAILASLLWIFTPIIVAQAQITRSDGAVQFFSYATLLLLLRLGERPSRKLRLSVAAIIACAISSHYKMAVLGMLWCWTEFRIWFANRSTVPPLKALGSFAAACGLCIAVFIALNPYLFVHADVLRRNLADQIPTQHPGADGLSPFGNLFWYLTSGLPDNFGWFATCLALIGIGCVFWKGLARARLLIAFVALYLLIIIWSPLHWPRWLAVILPALGALALHGFFTLNERAPDSLRRPVLIIGMVLLFAPRAYDLTFQNIRNCSFNTRIQALAWVKENVPPGSKIAYEWYTAPLAREYYKSMEVHALPAYKGGIDRFNAEGFQYLIVSSNMKNRFLAAPERYKPENDFYRELEQSAQLAASFMPSRTVGGPEIWIYRLDHAKTP